DLIAASERRASVMLLFGTPATKARPRSMRMSAGAASSSSAATACAFCFTSRAVCATAGPELAMTPLPPLPMPYRNCLLSPDPVAQVRARPGGGDLREGGRVSLALRGDADDPVPLAARVNAHGGALVGADSRALGVARHADAEPTRPLLLLLLAGAPLVVAQK